MTPDCLARQLVDQLQPSGRMLEPCAGEGAFVRALAPRGHVEWCEIDRGRDFFAWETPVDWIVTNPPWSGFRRVLEHSLEVAAHVALMATVNHWWTTRRVRAIEAAGFGYERLLLFDRPPEFKSTGFQLGMMLVSRGYRGSLQITQLVQPVTRTEAGQTSFVYTEDKARGAR
jgi:hypothetical protein